MTSDGHPIDSEQPAPIDGESQARPPSRRFLTPWKAPGEAGHWCATRHAALLWAGLSAGVALLYGGALKNGFTYDDHAQITQNLWLRGVGHIADIVSSDVWGFQPGPVTNYYRPLMHLINLVVYSLAGPAPAAFHLVSVALHALNCALFGVLLTVAAGEAEGASSRALGSLPLVAAALFAVHPVHAEAVAWASASPDLLLTFFGLTAFIGYLRLPAPGSGGRRVSPVSLASFALALLSKETAVMLPAVLVAYDATVRRRRWRELGKDLAARYAPYLALLLLYFGVRVLVLGAVLPVAAPRGPSSLASTVGIPLQSLSWYLGRLVLPVGYNFFPTRAPPDSLLSASVAPGLLALGALAVSWRRLLRGDGLRRWALVLFGAPLLPALCTTALKTPTTDRYLYLPCAGFCLMLGWYLCPRKDRAANGGRWRCLGLGILLLAYAALMEGRIRLFRDDYTLWSHTVRQSPQAGEARAWLATALFREGRVGEGLREARLAVSLGTAEPDNYFNIGWALLSLGRGDEAIEWLRRAVDLNPRDGATCRLLGDLYLERGDARRAALYFRKGVEADPLDALAYHGLGMALEAGGHPGPASEALGRATLLSPAQTSWQRDLRRVRGRGPKG